MNISGNAQLRLLAALVTGVVSACSADVGGVSADGDGGAPPASGTPDSGSVDPVPGGPGGTGGPGGIGGGPVSPVPGGCGGDRYQAEARQLDIYMIVDESGSMVPWWPFVIPAINSFLMAPEAAGIGVGMQLFGRDCSPATYATPRVPIAPLPGNAAAIGAAFPILPISGTATLPAIQGAIQHARSWAASHPDSKVVVLLVTDGLPSECASSVENVAEAAREGFSGSVSIPTYVLGLPLLEPLNPIAVAGGTQRAYAADPSNSQALIAAMNEIRGQALPCDYAMPDDANDPSLVNLDYVPNGGATQRLPQVPNREACTGAANGWYYDDPANPRRIVACEQTCTELKAGGGQLDVVVGCPTVTLL